MTPLGGTELQMAELEKRLSADYFQKIKITLSIPEKEPLDRDRINILWMKNSYDQPNIAPWFNEPENLRKYDWYVFNSHWNYEKFRYLYKMPTHKCSVIKNALPTIKWKERKTWKPGDPVKLIHISTPWRGLNVLLGTMELIKDSNITLDVYSSTQLYGDQFKEANDKRFQPMYEKMEKMPNVNYIGYKPNLEVIDAMQESNMFVYPCIWEETSCISAVEAMATGNVAVITNFGALFETCTDYAYYLRGLSAFTDDSGLFTRYFEIVEFLTAPCEYFNTPLACLYLACLYFFLSDKRNVNSSTSVNSEKYGIICAFAVLFFRLMLEREK